MPSLKILTFSIYLLSSFFLTLNANEDCSQDKSKEFNKTLGRCVSKKSSLETNKAYEACTKIEDQTARTQCLKDLAKSEVGEAGKAELEGPGDLAGASVNVIASGAIGVSSMFGEEGNFTSCYGKMMATATGTVGVAAQQYFVYNSKKEIEDIQKKFEESQAEDDYQTQLNTFNYLKEEQEAIVSLAETRRNSYYILSAGYAAAAATSLVSDNGKPDCTTSEGNPAVNETADTQALDIPKAKAGEEVPVLKPTEGEIEATKVAKQNYGSMIDSPPGVAVISAAAAGWNLYLGKAAADQAEKAKENAKEIDEIIAKFKDTVAGNCPKGRNDYKEGRCYCYNADGTKNQSHSRSETCKNLWAGDDKNLYAKSSDKTFTGEIIDKKGCLTKDKQFDEKCKCKKFIDDKGQNACFKSGFTSLPTGALNSGLSNNAIGDNLDKLTGSNKNEFDLSGDQLAKLARSSNNKLKKILKKLGANKPNNSLSNVPIDDNLYKSLARKIANKSPKLMASLGNGSSSALSPYTNKSKNAKNALSKVKKHLKKSTYGGGKGLSKNKSKNHKPFQFDSIEGSARGSKIKNYPTNKKYDYKNNDIVMRKDLSLWKVISNRYNNTGLRRLFSE